MKYFIAIVMLMLSMSAFALDSRDIGQAGFDKLSKAQQAALISQVDKMAKESADPATSTADTVGKYIDVSERFAKMMGGAAKELGIAVNDFAKTPVGQMTAALIVWKLIGVSLIHVFGGIFFFISGIGFILYMVRRVRTVTITYDETKTNIFGNHPVLSKKSSELDSAYAGGFSFAAAVVLAASAFIMFTL